jgi:CelD/BcsL family acetyltransferase involved in cellulose biosynthesis
VQDGLDPAIDEVAAAGPSARAFLGHGWFEAALAGEKARTIVMRREGGEAVVALPVAAGAYGVQAVPGSYWPFRSFPVAGDLTAGELETLLAAPAVKRALGHAWRIGPIHSVDPALHLIEQIADRAGWRLIRRRTGTSFQVDFAAIAAEGQWPRNSTLRRNRQLERKMAELGPLEWLSLSGARLTPQLLDELAALEAKSWQGTSRDAKFLAPDHRKLWDQLIADPDQAARLRVQALKIDGTLAAWRIQIEVAPMIYSIATSYDPAYRSLGPGICLATRALVAARDAGFERFDWGSGDSGYKQTLGAGPGPDIVDCLLIRGPLAGIAAPALERVWRRHETVKVEEAPADD